MNNIYIQSTHLSVSYKNCEIVKWLQRENNFT